MIDFFKFIYLIRRNKENINQKSAHAYTHNTHIRTHARTHAHRRANTHTHTHIFK